MLFVTKIYIWEKNIRKSILNTKTMKQKQEALPVYTIIYDPCLQNKPECPVIFSYRQKKWKKSVFVEFEVFTKMS